MHKLPKNIKQVNFSLDEWCKEEHKKTQIYLHHTAGRGSGEKTFQYWDSDTQGKIATCVCISNGNDGGIDGQIVQGFSSKFWAYHLGLNNRHFKRLGLKYKELNKLSIGIEICAWGALTFRSGKYFSWANVEVPIQDVETLETPWRNIAHFHKYTQKQIDSVCELLLYWKDIYDIDITYKPENFWDISKDALIGKSGLYSHAAVRFDKSDIFPCNALLSALKNIS